MPEPAYIICSRSSSVDPSTRLTTLHDIVEAVLVIRLDPATQPAPPQPPPLCITAAWLRTPGETDEQRFEYRFAVAVPPDGMQLDLGGGEFSFGAHPLFRITALGTLGLPATPGLARFLCRVRPAGSNDEWAEQSYRVPVIEAPPPGPPAGG
jgi:hypothetical protein